MRTAEPALAAEVAAWPGRAAEVDAAADREHGADRRGDAAPARMAAKRRRLGAIRAAKSAPEKPEASGGSCRGASTRSEASGR